MPLLKPGLCPLLTDTVAEKLASHGIRKVIDFVCTEPSKITSQCEIPHKTVLSIRRVLLVQYSSFPTNGYNLYEECFATFSILETGCLELDNLLNSGVFTGELTEIRGPASSGKTQLCTSLAVNIAISTQNVIYIDCSCGFSPERTAQIIKQRSKDEVKNITETMSRIRVCNSTSTYHLLDILTVIRDGLNSQDDNFMIHLKAIVIDSLSAVMSPSMRSLSYIEGQSLLTTVKNGLNSIAKDFTLALVVTTDVNVENDDTNKIKSPFGHIWSTAASTQLDLFRQCGPGSLQDWNHKLMVSPRPIKITLKKSTHTKPGDSVFVDIAESGLTAVK